MSISEHQLGVQQIWNFWFVVDRSSSLGHSSGVTERLTDGDQSELARQSRLLVFSDDVDGVGESIHDEVVLQNTAVRLDLVAEGLHLADTVRMEFEVYGEVDSGLGALVDWLLGNNIERLSVGEVVGERWKKKVELSLDS